MLSAQVIRGSVRTASAEIPVVAAEIVLEQTAYRAQTGHDGAFSIYASPGNYHVTVRAVGFRPLSADAILAANDTIDVVLLLTPLALQLAPLEVTGSPPTRLTAKMRAFEERRREGFGHFLARENLERWDHGPITGALRTIVGLTLVPLPCSGGYGLATSRQGNVRSGGVYCTGINGIQLVPPACYLSVWLDGVRIWSVGSDPPPDMDAIMALDLEAVEVYRGPAELPTQYLTTGSACGAVLFWSRDK